MLKHSHLYRNRLYTTDDLIDAVREFIYEHNLLKPMLAFSSKTPNEAYHQSESSFPLGELIADGGYTRKADNRDMSCGECFE